MAAPRSSRRDRPVATGRRWRRWSGDAAPRRQASAAALRRFSRIAAIEHALQTGTVLHKYADPIEGARDNLTADDAYAVALEDPSLIWCDVDHDPSFTRARRGAARALGRERALGERHADHGGQRRSSRWCAEGGARLRTRLPLDSASRRRGDHVGR